MATAKKAPVAAKKAVAKPAPVAKKAVSKKEPAPAVKYKPGQALIGTSGHGHKTSGRFAGVEVNASGAWVMLNIAPKGKSAEIKRYRPKAVSAA